MTKYSIVGTGHRNSTEFLANLKIGTPVKLVREPSNGYDPNAIMVWIDGNHVGYIPKKQNAALAQFIDQTGEPCIITGTLEKPGHASNRAIEAKFVRSPNSGFPQVEVE